MKKILFVILTVFLMPDAFSQSNNERNADVGAKEINIRFENKKKKGYYNTTQIAMLMGNRQIAERAPYYFYPYSYLSSSSLYVPYYYARTELQVSPSITMTNGYLFNEHWAAGIGVGFEIFTRNYFPVFADIQYTLWDNKISPFFAAKMGYAIGNFKKKHYDSLNLDFEPYYVSNADFRNYGGLMLHPEMGVKIPLSENADLLFTVAYRYQKTKSKVTQNNDPTYYNEWEHKESLNRMSFGIAIMFR
jgi:hypothetical protein